MQILTWYLVPTLLGWCCLPLTKRIFSFLPGRGVGFSRVLGLLIWGYFYWLISVLTGVRTGPWLQRLVLAGLLGFSAFLAYREGIFATWVWIKTHWRLLLSIEGIFLIAYAGFLVFRAQSPAIVATEKPMELAFLNAILRAETLPPPDPWLSGYSISYYYLGYVLVAMLAGILGTASGVAFNLAQGLWFALVAAGSYGLLVELLTLFVGRKSAEEVSHPPGWALRAGVIAPVLILLLGNAFGFLDVLHARGVFWQEGSGVQAISRFWPWLNLRELVEPPPFPYQWCPERAGSVGWWSASRVIQDFGWDSRPVEVIDEFPNFSFILGDLHPHVLAIPFVLLALGLALNAFVSKPDPTRILGRLRLPVNPGRFILTSGLIGALAFINIWDWPIYAALFAAVYAIHQAADHGWSLRILWVFLLYGLGMALTGYLLFWPYFNHFSSQASGILPALMYFTRGVYFWIMFGPLLILVFGYLFFLWRGKEIPNSAWRKSSLFMGALLLLLVAFNVLAGWVGSRLPELAPLFMANQGAAGVSFGRLLASAGLQRLLQPGTTITLSVLLVISLGLMFTRACQNCEPQKLPLDIFVILLILWAGLLTFIPEYVYLLDFFGKRMNTIFKFYYQAWILWSLAGAFSLVVLWRQAILDRARLPRILLVGFILLMASVIILTVVFPDAGKGKLWWTMHGFGAYPLDGLWAALGLVSVAGLAYFVIRRYWGWLFRWAAVAVLGMGFFYPALAIYERSRPFENFSEMTLDGTRIYHQKSPDLMAAVDWLWTAEPGVIAEAVHPEGGSYTRFARVSTLTGLPTVLGWRFHEVQWRGGIEEIGDRQADIALLYETLNWQTAKCIINMYNIDYIFIGDLERSTYALDDRKFDENLATVFRQGNVVIYRTAIE